MKIEREAEWDAGCSPGSRPGAFLSPTSIGEKESDPWRVLVTVCAVDGSCRDAARGVMANATATGMEVNN